MTVFIPAQQISRAGQDRPARPGAEVPYLLVNPPLTDPTAPYHSIPYLVGATQDRGFTNLRCLDANVEALNLLAAPDQVGRLLTKADELKQRLETQQTLSHGDELAYRVAVSCAGLEPDFAQAAIWALRDQTDFYHYPTYQEATSAIKLWLRLICLDGLPESYDGFEVRVGGMANLSSYEDLCDERLIDALTSPFDSYIDGPYTASLRERDWAVIGFSVNYISQLPFALRLARVARRIRPEAVIVFGGTDTCDAVRFAKDPAAVWSLFADADVIVPGEGETALCDLLTAVRDGTSLAAARGVMLRGHSYGRPPIVYENVAALPAPDFTVWNWDDYWSPESVILYSPTRGCYWNKCTFCDYGLNTDRPTSPSRERPVDVVVRDLAAIQQIGRTIYFAVDAMSPRYLRVLCDALSEQDLGLRWSAELRLERTFPQRGMAAKLRQAGCIAVSFGYESASQRVLDLIDKGVRMSEVEPILRDLATAGVGAQMMGFTGFPTEQADEAALTYSYLTDRPGLWSLAAIGTFSLTPGSIVARSPERFGVELLPPPPNEDILRTLPWRDQATNVDHWPGEAEDRIAPELRAALDRPVDGRPWVGGTDSAHTLLYFARYGRDLLPASAGDDPRRKFVGARDCAVGFAELDTFTTAGDMTTTFIALRERGGAGYRSMSEWYRAPGNARPEPGHALVLPSGAVVPLPSGVTSTSDGMRRFIAMAAARPSAE